MELKYNSVTTLKDTTDLKETSKYLLNYVTSAYNDVCDYDLFKPIETVNIYKLKVTVNILNFTTTNNVFGILFYFSNTNT